MDRLCQTGGMTEDVAQLSYEQAREELAVAVRTLEAGATTLEESMALWERGEALAARCQEWLDGARQRLAAVRDAQQDGEHDPAAGGPDTAGATGEAGASER